MLITRIFSSSVVFSFMLSGGRGRRKKPVKDESLLCFCLLSYLAWWSFDYLCEKLDLTCKRNHISSFFYFFLPFFFSSSASIRGLIVRYAHCFYTHFFLFDFNDLLIPRLRAPALSGVRYDFNFFFIQI